MVPLPAGMIETCSRLMAYTEIVAFNIKQFLSKPTNAKEKKMTFLCFHLQIN